MGLFLGIDNGLDGGIVVIDDSCEVVLKLPMPTIGTKGKGKRDYDLQAIVAAVRNLDIQHACLEYAQAMPGQGVTSMFSIGKGYGVMLMLLASLSIPYTVVRPQAWQKAILADVDRTDTKKASAVIAQRLAPMTDWRATARSKKPHDGMTDSFCIAVYAKRFC